MQALTSRHWRWIIPKIRPAHQDGGDVGYVPESALDKPPVDPALKKAVLSLKAGQTSGVIALKDGSYNIIKLIAREGTGQRDLSDPQVMQLIRDNLARAAKINYCAPRFLPSCAATQRFRTILRSRLWNPAASCRQ